VVCERGLCMGVLKKIKPVVDRSVTRLRKKAFECDPLMGAELSRITSVVSSAYKRHGHILEAAIKGVLKEHERFQVWSIPKLSISEAAENLATSYMGKPKAALKAAIEHEEDGRRTLQIDLIVYDKKKRTVSSYEIKRGAGTHDAGKKRSMLRDMLCTQVVLKSFAELKLGVKSKSAHSYMIFYYGKESIGAPFSLSRDDLDDHFGIPVRKEVESVNSYYRKQIEGVLAG
jgi:hypothetical protein